MFRKFAASAAVLALFAASPVLAAGNNNQTQNTMQSAQSLPQELKQKLTSQGFTNVQIVPGSFIVSAKDKQGDPVTMIIGPNSMTVFAMSSSGDNMTTGSVKSGNTSTTD